MVLKSKKTKTEKPEEEQQQEEGGAAAEAETVGGGEKKKTKKKAAAPDAPGKEGQEKKVKKKKRESAAGEVADEQGGETAPDQQEGAKKKKKKKKKKRKARTAKMRRDARKVRAKEAEERAAGKGSKRSKTQPAEAPVEEEDLLLDNRIYCGGLGELIGEKPLKKIFGTFGEIKRTELIRCSRGILRGSAFVTFTTKEASEAALAVEGTQFKDKTLTAVKARIPERKPPCTVYIGNLPWNVEQEVLKKDFMECGTIIRFRMLFDAESGKPRGMAFVKYALESGAEAALKFNNTEYGGRTITVQIAKLQNSGGHTMGGNVAQAGGRKDTGESSGGKKGGDSKGAGKGGEEKGKERSSTKRKVERKSNEEDNPLVKKTRAE